MLSQSLLSLSLSPVYFWTTLFFGGIFLEGGTKIYNTGFLRRLDFLYLIFNQERMADETKVADDSKTVHLVSQEGESFDVPVSVARMSELVKSMIDGTVLFFCIKFKGYKYYFQQRVKMKTRHRKFRCQMLRRPL